MQDKPLVAVFDLVTSVGGVQTVMADLLPRLTDRFRVGVVDAYCHPDYARLLSGSTIELVMLGGVPQQRFIGGKGRVERLGNLAKRAPWLLSTGLRLRRWVLTRRPSVIYFNQLPSLLFFSRFLPALAPRIVYHAHGMWSPAEIQSAPFVGQRCSRILAVSEAAAEVMTRAGVNRSKVSVVHNGVDADHLRRKAYSCSAPLPPRAPGEVVILHAAVLAPNKQQHRSIEAVADLPSHVVLWLCGDVADGGDCSYAVQLRDLADKLGVASRVRFLGWREDVPFVVAGADVVILPSLQEGLPRVLLEAMALGKPCVGTAVGGIPEVIEHGVTGFVTRADPRELASVLGELAASPESRLAMGEAGSQRVEQLFALARQAERIGGVLEAVAEECRARGGVKWHDLRLANRSATREVGRE
jgi:glycosyltransferase involved in cell wall biosynthesis